MNYTKPKFSVPMPGPDVKWPFDNKTDGTTCWYEECPECGAQAVTSSKGRAAHIDGRDVAAKRPRKRVCFGRIIA